MISIVIPAHNEATVVARILRALLAGARPGELDIVVICNGCTDRTAEVARHFAPAVRVIETSVPGKTNALNLGDAAVHSFPRIYIDADVIITLEAVRALARRLAAGDVHAVAPIPVLDVKGCSRLVRTYYAVRSLLPSASQGIGGSGVYALSSEGRARFTTFPRITADDAYVKLLFAPTERATVPSALSTVHAPQTLRSLFAVRTRIYFGIGELARRFPQSAANADESNDRALIGLLRRPTMWFAVATYLAVNVLARCVAYSRRGLAPKWAQDKSSRGQGA